MGSNSGIEAAEAEKAGLRFVGLELMGVAGRRPLETARSLYMFKTALLRCRKLFKEERPEVIIGTGGYAAAPACFAAAMCGVPLVLHEMNYFPGLVTRSLSRRADIVSTAYSGTAAYLSKRAHVALTGVPVREEIAGLRDKTVHESAREAALAYFGLADGKRTLLVFGGSQGARALNQAVSRMKDYIAAVPGVQVLHVTGSRRPEERESGESGDRGGGGSYVAWEYCHRMDLAYAAADLALCRAGAGTLAELKAAVVPAVIVPYPYATRGHQEMNAAEFEKQGAAKVVLQEGDSAVNAVREALSLLDSHDELESMRESMRAMPGANGSEGIAALVEELRTRTRH
jgi:UDP-N-acetylglucosamine--N-acetylmuramyl-(pentapeptide) pyrophosphoryl-undecaprenol N-acetylglucosamine transferase